MITCRMFKAEILPRVILVSSPKQVIMCLGPFRAVFKARVIISAVNLHKLYTYYTNFQKVMISFYTNLELTTIHIILIFSNISEILSETGLLKKWLVLEGTDWFIFKLWILSGKSFLVKKLILKYPCTRLQFTDVN